MALAKSKKNACPPALPLYPTYQELLAWDIGERPELGCFFKDSAPWVHTLWQHGKDFLLYIGRNKSEHTYLRFRGEVEKFLLWASIVREKNPLEYRKAEILAYADFCWSPPAHWVALKSADRFIFHSGHFKVNAHWRPFRVRVDKSSVRNEDASRKSYRPSQESLKSNFTAIIAFYKYLIAEELCLGNPAQLAKPDCRYFIADAQVKEVRRLSEAQWQYVLETATQLADKDRAHERSLFIIAALKGLFLRISELAERPAWTPAMKHFWQDEHHNWWLKVYGKGRKVRDVSIPQDFLAYLKRYRRSRLLSDLPSPNDTSAIVEKIRGQGGMSARQLSRIVQKVFDEAYEKMKQSEGEDHARKLKEASTHWLRHTGASMEIERGRALKDVSEDLGHASMATTDTIYVQSEHRRRADSGKNRKI